MEQEEEQEQQVNGEMEDEAQDDMKETKEEVLSPAKRKDDEDQLANGISRINLSELSMLNRTE